MANLLNFNPSRIIEFSPNRNLDFTVDRTLVFDPNRGLGFQPNRDLGFGKRGVLFRGFACESCGALASPDATICDECGALFEDAKTMPRIPPEREVRAVTEETASPVPATLPPPASTTPLVETARAKAAGRFCPNCGARSWSGDAFCWNCGFRFSGGQSTAPPATARKSAVATEAIRLPQKRAKKVMKDWQETEKSLSEFAEEK